MESDLEKEVVQLRCVEGELQPDLLMLSRDRIFSTLKAAKVMFADSCENVSFGVIVSDKRLASECHGKNLQKQTVSEWMQSAAGVSVQTELNVADAELQEQLNEMASCVDDNGRPRDVLREAQLRADPEFASHFFTDNLDAFSDNRPSLSDDELRRGVVRCPIVDCSGKIKRGEIACPKCRCWPKSDCVCKVCRTSFDPNERTDCGICGEI